MTINRSLTVAAVAAFTAFQTAVLPAAQEKACTTAEPRTVMNLVNFLRGCEPRCKRDLVTPIVEQIKLCHAKGQPVLVGTISIERSELLSKRTRRRPSSASGSR